MNTTPQFLLDVRQVIDSRTYLSLKVIVKMVNILGLFELDIQGHII